jgi:hypothetical protein
MNADQFDSIVNETLARCRVTLVSKRKEYSQDQDRFHNFNIAARIRNTTPADALAGMAVKHDVSIVDMIEATKRNELLPARDIIDEKFTDAINYLLLLKGILIDYDDERRTEKRQEEVEAAIPKRSYECSACGIVTGSPVDWSFCGITRKHLCPQCKELQALAKPNFRHIAPGGMIPK